MTAAAELDALVPDAFRVRLSSGIEVEIQKLETIQLLKLMKIITRGGGPMFLELDIDFGDDTEVFGGKLAALVFMSVPEAPDETMAFLNAMVAPVGLVTGRGLDKTDRERNESLWADLRAAMANPPLEDTIDIIEGIVRRSAEDLQSLGKRLAHLWATLNPNAKKKSGQEKNSSEDSPAPSI